MKRTILLIILISGFAMMLPAQRIVFQSDFENITLQSPDSIPAGWWKADIDHNNSNVGWAVRDTSCNFGGNTRVRANNYSRKSLEIPWYAGNGGNMINDDWVWTDSFTVRQGDSLIFWMLIGSDTTFTAYLDSMQVYICSDQDPVFAIAKLAKIVSNDSEGVPLATNMWTEHKFNLSQWAGQKIYIGFRYNMNILIDGLWCNIDDLFIGNRSPIGIKPIGSNVPKSYALRQNYPNPFNPTTNIEFDLPKGENVKITLFNSVGQDVTTILNEFKAAGSYKIDFNASNLPSGAYYYTINAGDFRQTKKMVLVK
jgi:hypothetical protein